MTNETQFKKVIYAHQLEVVARRVKITETEEKYFSRTLGDPKTVYDNFWSVFTNSPVELFVVIHLKANNKLSAFEVVSKGTLNSSLVHPREVFRTAIMQNAAAILVAHNHPSGNTQPSQEDVSITKQLVEAGKVLGVPVHDHIIFTHEGYYSFAEHGII